MTGPPTAGSNTCAPTIRSAANPTSAPVNTGKDSSTRIPVNSTFQVKSGRRNMVMPGARMHRIVVMKFTDPRMVPRPATIRPSAHRSPPMPGDRTASASGT